MRVKEIRHNGNTMWADTAYIVAAPVVSCTNNVVTMTCSTSGATIRYSTNGGSTWQTYSSSITISATTTYKAYATKSGMIDSAQTSYTATYVKPTLPTPTVTSSGSYDSVTFTIKTTGISGVTYHYVTKYGAASAVTCSAMTDPTETTGNTKTGTGSDSTATVTMSNGCVRGIKVMGTKSGYNSSGIRCSTKSVC